jgi:hypothetical protein
MLKRITDTNEMLLLAENRYFPDKDILTHCFGHLPQNQHPVYRVPCSTNEYTLIRAVEPINERVIYDFNIANNINRKNKFQLINIVSYGIEIAGDCAGILIGSAGIYHSVFNMDNFSSVAVGIGGAILIGEVMFGRLLKNNRLI